MTTYYIKDSQKIPATLTPLQYKQLIPVPSHLVSDQYYLLENNALVIDTVHVLPAIDLRQHIINFHSLQSVGKRYEPTVQIDERLCKGYQRIIQYLQLGEHNDLTEKYVDALLIPYATFSPNLVEYQGVKNHRGEDYPVLTRTNSRGNGQYFGFGGLKRLFPYTPVNILMAYYNSPQRVWNYDKLTGEDLVYKYSLKRIGNHYHFKAYNQEIILGSQKDVLEFLRTRCSEVISNISAKQMWDRVKTYTKEDIFFKENRITIKDDKINILVKETGEVVILDNKSQFQKRYGFNWKQAEKLLADERVRKE